MVAIDPKTLLEGPRPVMIQRQISVAGESGGGKLDLMPGISGRFMPLRRMMHPPILAFRHLLYAFLS